MNILNLLSNGNRFIIFSYILRKGSGTGTEISRHFSFTQGYTAKVLRTFQQEGILQSERKDHEVFYSIPEKYKDLLTAIIQCVEEIEKN